VTKPAACEAKKLTAWEKLLGIALLAAGTILIVRE
jgi:hypothetical protein